MLKLRKKYKNIYKIIKLKGSYWKGKFKGLINDLNNIFSFNLFKAFMAEKVNKNQLKWIDGHAIIRRVKEIIKMLIRR